MNEPRHIAEEDLFLLATGSLEATETAAAKAHLSACAACRDSLAQVNDDLALFALSVDQVPLPSGAADRFKARIAAEPRAAGVQPTRSLPIEAAVLPFVAKDRPGPARKPLLTLLPWLLAAAMLGWVVYLGSQLTELRSSRDQARAEALRLAADAAQAQQVMDVLTARNSQQVTLTEGKPAPAPMGHTSYMPSKGALVFVATNLKPLPATKAYELWLIPANGHPPMPAGMFRPDDRGSASVVLPPLPTGVPAKAFGVTIERAEGSPTPTLPILLSGS